MLITIPGVLDAPALARVRELLDGAGFVDGRLSAGSDAVRVKHNEELDPQSRHVAELNRLVMGALNAHPLFQSAVLPSRVSAPFFARYTKGMRYGPHVDDPVMGEGARYRSDVSMTIFLNDPSDYAGGELRIRTGFGEQAVKRPAGDAVAYPSSTLHEVSEVTGGVRLVAVGWAQSLVRDPVRRELLYELWTSVESMRQALPDAEVTANLNKTYVNLVRMWSAP